MESLHVQEYYSTLSTDRNLELYMYIYGWGGGATLVVGLDCQSAFDPLRGPGYSGTMSRTLDNCYILCHKYSLPLCCVGPHVYWGLVCVKVTLNSLNHPTIDLHVKLYISSDFLQVAFGKDLGALREKGVSSFTSTITKLLYLMGQNIGDPTLSVSIDACGIRVLTLNVHFYTAIC